MNTTKRKRSADRPQQDAPDLGEVQFRREDWMDFRDASRISNKAGVTYERLPMVVVKELCDDALDAGGAVDFGLLEVTDDSLTFFVADAGPGIDGTNEGIAALYSIRRSLFSSKMGRRPSRGMLGNGLRVVAGVVLIAKGELRVSTRGRTLTLQPRAEDGKTAVVAVAPWNGIGTRIEVTLRGPLAEHARSDEDGGLFDWAEEARQLTRGASYKGKSSPHWYERDSFWQLCQAAGEVRIGSFVERILDGCSGKTTEVVSDLAGKPCGSITPDEAATLLHRAQLATRPVAAERLGKVGRRDDFFGYSGRLTGAFVAHGATIPFVVEAWANRSHQPGGTVAVNRTPVCTNVVVCRDQGCYFIFGCQLQEFFSAGRKDAGEFYVVVNIITPYVPLTSSGKEPDLSMMRDKIIVALEKAIRGAKRAPKFAGKSPSQKRIVRARIKNAAEKLSGGGQYLFSLRQLFYELRPYLIAALGKEPMYGTFSRIVGEYEDEVGDIEHLYRDDRGTLYHPHTKQAMPLGTQSVASYQRPPFGFHSLLFCEKEGLFPMLKHAAWPEQFDCALCSSKGFATRAVRALIRLLKDSPEPITVFVAHDADGPGTVIYETLAAALEASGIEVINLGLDPREGRDMGLAEEPVKRKKNKRVPVADYIPDEDKEWLQTSRIELNAMTTPQFVEWLTRKVLSYFRSKGLLPKVVPPEVVVGQRLVQETRVALERRITDEVIKAANIPQQVEAKMAKMKSPLQAAGKALANNLPHQLKNSPISHWTDIVKQEAAAVIAIKDGEKPVGNAKSEA